MDGKKKISRILIILRRSHGDVIIASPLVNGLRSIFTDPKIDLLVNTRTEETAGLLDGVSDILAFTPGKGQPLWGRIKAELKFITGILRKYDVSISLNPNERNSIYAFLASRRCMVCLEAGRKENFILKLLARYWFIFRHDINFIHNYFEPCRILGNGTEKIQLHLKIPESAKKKISKLLSTIEVKDFFLFHPSTRYLSKVYPLGPRNRLLELLITMNVPVIVSGGATEIDNIISESIPEHPNIINLIGKLSIAETAGLTDRCLAYIGMDTMNMHMATALNKKVFAIFGPTLTHQWAPWSNEKQQAAEGKARIESYGNIVLFRSTRDCVPCGRLGCLDDKTASPCLSDIQPETIFQEIKNWFYHKNNS